MENLGLRETFSRLNLSEVEPKVRYNSALWIRKDLFWILPVLCHDADPDPTFHFDTYPDPDPTQSFTLVGNQIFFLLIFTAVSVYIVLSCLSSHWCQNFLCFRQYLEIFWENYS
jgi:hypothetical protein